MSVMPNSPIKCLLCKIQSRQNNTEGEEKVGRLTPPDFKATVILAKHRQIDQWNRRKSPQIDPQKYSQLIVDKREKAIQ